MDQWKCRVQQRTCILVPHHENSSLNVKMLSSYDKTAATAASTLIPLARLTVTSVTKSLSRFSLAFKSNLSQSLPGFLATQFFLRTTENTSGRSSARRKSKMLDLSLAWCLTGSDEGSWFGLRFHSSVQADHLCATCQSSTVGKKMFSSTEKKPTITALIAKLNHFFFRLQFLSSEWNVLFRNRYRGPAARSGRVHQSEVTVPLLKAICRVFSFLNDASYALFFVLRGAC